MILTDEGIRLIQHFEGCRLTSYQDSAGIWTIGYGTTGPHVKPGMVITQIAADAMFKGDLVRFAEAVRSQLVVTVHDHQFSALVSLAYNIGSGAFGQSTLLRILNRGDYWGAANQIGVWIRAGGQVLNGLILRRAAERDMFCGFPARWAS
jgi:lysozyme